MRQTIPFAEWLPDIPALGNQGAITAKNVIPDQVSYLPFPNQVVFSTSLSARAQGAIIARDTVGNSYNFAGDNNKLYQLVGTSWSNVSRLVGGTYTTPTDEYWEFTQWGNTVIGVNGADAPQRLSLGAANFVVLPGAPPQARHITTVRDFVVLGNISATATMPQAIAWSAINNSDSWTANAATLADRQDLPGDGGWVQKVVGGEYGVIFQERAIFRMTFVGSPLIFQFDQVHQNIGAYAPQSVVAYQNLIFFLSEDGFYVFDGVSVKPIGRGKVDQTFFAELDTQYYLRVVATIDPVNKLVMWAYPVAGNTGGNPNRILIYNWAFNKWSRVEDINIELLTRSVSGIYTLDGLDAINTSIDALPWGLDSRQWNTGQLIFSCFNSSHQLARFNGSAMPATVDTGERQFNPRMNGKSYLTEVRPLIDGVSTSAQVTLITRNLLTESASAGTAMTPVSAGFAEVRSTARFHRVRVTTANGSDFSHLIGVDVEVQPDGGR